MKNRLEWGVATTVNKDTVTTVAASKQAAEAAVARTGLGKVVRVMTLR